MTLPKIDDFIKTYGKHNEKKIFDEKKALVYLFNKNVFFINSRPYVENPWDPKKKQNIAESTIVVFVNANDLFMWGCADGVEIKNNGMWDADIETNELFRLTSYMMENPKWGADKFCCWKRNLQPQKSRIKAMKKDRVWDDFMESLPKNPDFIKEYILK